MIRRILKTFVFFFSFVSLFVVSPKTALSVVVVEEVGDKKAVASGEEGKVKEGILVTVLISFVGVGVDVL